ncbi:MAG TPA: metallophosphoesterase [Terriglobales bacterium]|nr:metallophosphoesterase [Terriglobales bacterium]
MASDTKCLFATDLHGQASRYDKLLAAIQDLSPAAVFLGGDLLPHALHGDLEQSEVIHCFCKLRQSMGNAYPKVFIILGNDDPRSFETCLFEYEQQGLWCHAHNRRAVLGTNPVYGYACVPPTPFRLKDWERYDVSRYCDPGCISPEEGIHTVAVEENEIKWGTIGKDLDGLAGEESLERAVFLFHCPPYDTPLDHADLEGTRFEHAPVDPHVGSIAIRRFIENRQPLLTLHGHVHESTRLTGTWKTRIGRTTCINASHDGPELAVVQFDLEAPSEAVRFLI